MGRSYSDKALKILWGLAAGRCAFPDCRQLCVAEPTDYDPAATIGIVAHIEGFSDSGPRANLNLTVKQRNRYENLILLCGTHHDLVDVQENTYKIVDLRTWKIEHETWVRSRLAVEMPEVTFAELEVVTQGILNSHSAPSDDFIVIDPREKMKQNGLTEKIEFLLTMGVGKAGEVEHFVSHVSVLDSKFPERLKTGFVHQYRQLRDEGFYGDSLFEGLREFACTTQEDFKRQAAGLAILAYLFQTCEVFEH